MADRSKRSPTERPTLLISGTAGTASRPSPDALLVEIARYVCRRDVGGSVARNIARHCLYDALGCALRAVNVPDCRRLLGPLAPGTMVPNGARVPGTSFVLDPVKAAFDIGCLIRWLDFNDSCPTGGHPSDNIGAILAATDFLSCQRVRHGEPPLLMHDVITAIIKAYEILGILSEGNSFDRPGIGLDSVMLVKIASAATVAQLLGGDEAQVINALSNVFADGQSLNVYRKVPNAGTRKSWAAGDAASRGVRFALMAVQGEMGYPTALTDKTWGFYAVTYREGPLSIPRPFECSVVENIQFKVSYPTQRHAQTAADCAVRLHAQLAGRYEDIERVVISTHELAKKMISVKGPLHTVAARDHCLEYVVAIGLLHGTITELSYGDAFASDGRIDALRSLMTVETDDRFTKGYEDPERRSNGNAVQVFFNDGSATARIEVEYPVGSPNRREEGLPRVVDKFTGPFLQHLGRAGESALELFHAPERFAATPVNEFMALVAVDDGLATVPGAQPHGSATSRPIPLN